MLKACQAKALISKKEISISKITTHIEYKLLPNNQLLYRSLRQYLGINLTADLSLTTASDSEPILPR